MFDSPRDARMDGTVLPQGLAWGATEGEGIRGRVTEKPSRCGDLVGMPDGSMLASPLKRGLVRFLSNTSGGLVLWKGRLRMKKKRPTFRWEVVVEHDHIVRNCLIGRTETTLTVKATCFDAAMKAAEDQCEWPNPKVMRVAKLDDEKQEAMFR